MFGPVGWQEILLILVLALLVFGPRRLPELGRTLGRAMAEFRRATTDLKRTLNAELALEEGERSRTPRRPEPATAPSEPSEPDGRPRREPAGPPEATMPRGAEALDLAGVVDDGGEERETEPAAEAAATDGASGDADEPASDDAPAEQDERDDREPAPTH